MLAFIQISINLLLLGAIVVASAVLGYLIKNAKLKSHLKNISRLEMEMLHNHSEILRLHKELSEKETSPSKTPIFSIKDNTAEPEQLQGMRLTKKVSGNGKSTS